MRKCWKGTGSQTSREHCGPDHFLLKNSLYKYRIVIHIEREPLLLLQCLRNSTYAVRGVVMLVYFFGGFHSMMGFYSMMGFHCIYKINFAFEDFEQYMCPHTSLHIWENNWENISVTPGFLVCIHIVYFKHVAKLSTVRHSQLTFSS